MSDRWRNGAFVAGPGIVATSALLTGGTFDTWLQFLPAALLAHIIDSTATVHDKGAAVGVIALIVALLGSASTLIGRRHV